MAKKRYYVSVVRLKTTVQLGTVVVEADTSDDVEIRELARKAIDEKKAMYDCDDSDHYSPWTISFRDEIEYEEIE